MKKNFGDGGTDQVRPIIYIPIYIGGDDDI